MKINGIDYNARMTVLAERDVKWDSSDHTQFGTPSVYCNQHLSVHLTALSSCMVHNVEKFALSAVTFEAALTEARDKGFHIYGDPRACQHCGVDVTDKSSSSGDYKDASGSSRCAAEGRKRAPFHAPVRDWSMPDNI